MWISVSERGGLFIFFFPKAQSRPVTDMASHKVHPLCWLAMGTPDATTQKTLFCINCLLFCEMGETGIQIVLGMMAERHYQISLESFTDQPLCNIYLGSLLVNLHL